MEQTMTPDEALVWDLVDAIRSLPPPAAPMAAALVLAEGDAGLGLPDGTAMRIGALLQALGGPTPATTERDHVALIGAWRYSKMVNSVHEAQSSPQWAELQLRNLTAHALLAFDMLQDVLKFATRRVELAASRG